MSGTAAEGHSEESPETRVSKLRRAVARAEIWLVGAGGLVLVLAATIIKAACKIDPESGVYARRAP